MAAPDTSDQLSAAYDQLRGLAHQFLSEQRPDHTLQATELVHEAYLRLADHSYVAGLNPAQLLCVAAKAMRHILVDHARRRRAQKRGGDGTRVPLDEALTLYQRQAVDVVVLDEALEQLAEVDPDLVRVIELRFFGGLTEQETAEAMDRSTRTVRREWRLARRWLSTHLK